MREYRKYCDRKIIACYAGAQRDLPGELVREIVVEAVVARFVRASMGSLSLEL